MITHTIINEGFVAKHRQIIIALTNRQLLGTSFEKPVTIIVVTRSIIKIFEGKDASGAGEDYSWRNHDWEYNAIRGDL